MDINQSMESLRNADNARSIGYGEQSAPDFAALATRAAQRRMARLGGLCALVALPVAAMAFATMRGGETQTGFRSASNSSANASTVKATGATKLTLAAGEKTVADQNFRSPIDGFGFANWGGAAAADAMDATSMVALFGKESVCVDAKASTCVMLPGAQAVAKQLNAALAAGRCEGMAVLSQRFFDKHDALPSGRTSTSTITKDEIVKKIGYWWATQVSPEVANASKKTRAMGPTQIAGEIAKGLSSKMGYTLGLYTEKGGHSVTPIAVTAAGGTTTIHVYDNNYPNEIRKVTIDTKSDKWSYAGAGTNSSNAKATWSGGKGSMDITPMSARKAPFKVSLGGTRGIKGTAYTVIVAQEGDGTSPVGVEIEGGGVLVNTLSAKSVVEAPFPVKTFVGDGGMGQGAFALVPVTLADSGKMRLKVLGNPSAGPISVSLMRTGSAGVVVESASEFSMEVTSNLFTSSVDVTLPSATDTAVVQVSNGSRAAEVELTKGQGLDVNTTVLNDDASVLGDRRVEQPLPEFTVADFSGKVLFSGQVANRANPGEAIVTRYQYDEQSGDVTTTDTTVEPQEVDQSFVEDMNRPLEEDGATGEPAEMLDLSGIQLRAGALPEEEPQQTSPSSTIAPIRAAAPTTTTTAPAPTTTTTVLTAPAPAPAPTTSTTVAPEQTFFRLSVQGERFFGSTGASWDLDGLSCESSSSAACADALGMMGSEDLTMVTPESFADIGDYAVSVAMTDEAEDYMAGFDVIELNVTLTILPKPVTVTASGTKVFGETDPTYTLSWSDAEAEGTATGDVVREVGEDVNTYPFSLGSLTVSSNYSVTVTGSFAITAKPVTVTASGTKVFGEADPKPTLSWSDAGALATASGDVLRASGENVGSYPFELGSLTVSSNYSVTVTGSFVITAKRVTVTASGTKVFGEADPKPTLSWSDAGAQATASGDVVRVAGEDVNTYSFSLGSLMVSSNYSVTVSGSFVITAKPVTVTASGTKVFGETDPEFELSWSDAGAKATATGAVLRASGENVGSYPFELGSLTVSKNYSVTVSGSFVITAKPVTVTASGTKVFGAVDPTYTLVWSDPQAALVATGSVSRASGEDVGSYTITGGNLASSNYSVSVSGSFVITAKPVTVTASGTKVFGAVDPTYTLVWSDAGAQATASGDVVREAGEDVKTYSFSLGSLTVSRNYSLSVSGSFSITVKPVTVTASGTKVFGETDPEFELSWSDPEAAKTQSGRVTRAAGENAGSYAFSQGTLSVGSNYVVTVTGSFVITAKPVTVTASGTKVQGEADPSYTLDWNGNADAASMASGSVVRASGEAVGSYPFSQGTLTAGANYSLTVNGSFVITAKPLANCGGGNLEDDATAGCDSTKNDNPDDQPTGKGKTKNS